MTLLHLLGRAELTIEGVGATLDAECPHCRTGAKLLELRVRARLPIVPAETVLRCEACGGIAQRNGVLARGTYAAALALFMAFVAIPTGGAAYFGFVLVAGVARGAPMEWGLAGAIVGVLLAGGIGLVFCGRRVAAALRPGLVRSDLRMNDNGRLAL